MTRSLAESLGAGHTASGWATDFLTAIGAPANARNVNAVVTWENHESGGGGGQFNPLNTTQTGFSGETPYNSNGGYPVQNYTTYADGIAANAQAFNSGARRGLYGYDRILAAFNDKGASIGDIFAAINASSWGTHGLPTDGAVSSDVSGVQSSGGGTAANLTSTGVDTSSDNDCLLKLPGVNLGIGTLGGNCLLRRSQGRALLGFVCLAGGGAIVALGLVFLAANSRARKIIPTPLPA